ncbi:MAG TPA: class II aldolase/adducin family protein [Candidatus Izemoplasmatales bacterium]|nr:class II aldolase/adducin family protein [Bacillota bacterium]HRY77554.1 class II aldolase/adducin family protein [Candidatus Izemoplasmatales bacterium]
MNFTYMHPAEQIVMIINRIYTKQMTTTSGGNLSILDDEGNLWITPSGIDKGTLSIGDICQIKPDGTVIGKHRPSSELPFHKCVYAARPDVRAVLHAHPQALVSFSLVGKVPNTKIIPSPHLVCGEIGFAEYGLPGSIELGNKLAEQFRKGRNVVIMENHGVVTCGKDLFEAFMIFETLERAAALNIVAHQLGTPSVLTDEQIYLGVDHGKTPLAEFLPGEIPSYEKKARKDMCALIHRAYDQELFTSTQGTFSERLDDHAFLITPYGMDRKYLEPEDLVRIENGKREAGKTPSRAYRIHQMIYERHPQVNAVVMATPTHVMAFGITRTPLDPRTIPESYIMIRDLVRVPYGTSVLNPEQIAEAISESTPVILAENEFVLTVGSTLINAFDRLEVAEFTANTIIHAMTIGQIAPISQDRIEEINKAFHLN